MWSFMMLLLIPLGSADKLDRLYLPPTNAMYSGGSPGDIEVPFELTKLSQSLDEKINPEKPLSEFASDRISTAMDPSDSYISVINNEPSFAIPSTAEQAYFHKSSLPKTDGENIYDPLDKHTSSNGGEESNNAFNIPSIVSTHSKEINPMQERTVSNTPSSNPIFPNDKTRNSLKSNTYNLSSTSTTTENPNDLSKPPLFIKQYSYQPSFNNVAFPTKTNLGDVLVRQYPERILAEADRNAFILNHDNVINPKDYAYSYDTSNGIHADENGTTLDGTKAKGSYSYIGDDGKNYTVHYTADERGFQPRGDHLPTPPPIPDAIKKALEQITESERNGIFNDGSYDESKYGYKNYHNPGLKESALNRNKYKSTTNLPMDRDNRLSTKDIHTPSQNRQKVTPVLGEESLVDDEYDTENEYKDNGEKFKEYVNPINANTQGDGDTFDKANNNKFNQNLVTNSKPSSLIGNKSFTKSFRPDQNNELPSNSFMQDSNLKTDQSNTPMGLESLKDLQNSRIYIDTYSTPSTVTQSGYQYFPPQARFTPQANAFSSPYTVNDNQLIPKLSTSAVLQHNENNYQNPQQQFKPQPISYKIQQLSPILQKEFEINSNRNDNDFDNSAKKFVDDTDFLVPFPIEGVNLLVKQDTKTGNKNKFTPVIKNSVYPKDIEFDQKENSLPNQNSNIGFHYSSTPEPSQFLTHYGGYRPTDKVRIPEQNFGFSTTNKPSLFTNDPKNVEKSRQNIETTVPIFNKKLNLEGVVPNNNIIENVPQSTRVSLTDGPETTSKNYPEPQFTSTATTFETPEHNFNQNYQPLSDIYRIRPSTKRILGEDFSGPKQPQKFDPITGYHY